MTKQEAIDILWRYDVNFEPHPAEEVMHAIDMAIEALSTSQNLSEPINDLKGYDLISRADIEWHDYLVADGDGMYHDEQVAYRSQIDALPSVNPDLSGFCDRLWKSAYDRGYARCKQDAIDAVYISQRKGLV
ncbi:MAG: hypothetical protein IKE94_15975 [Aeriscardovia sp.]|nr:hypothetical protein [Aeriscardovia sp.]